MQLIFEATFAVQAVHSHFPKSPNKHKAHNALSANKHSSHLGHDMGIELQGVQLALPPGLAPRVSGYPQEVDVRHAGDLHRALEAAGRWRAVLGWLRLVRGWYAWPCAESQGGSGSCGTNADKCQRQQPVVQPPAGGHCSRASTWLQPGVECCMHQQGAARSRIAHLRNRPMWERCSGSNSNRSWPL